MSPISNNVLSIGYQIKYLIWFCLILLIVCVISILMIRGSTYSSLLRGEISLYKIIIIGIFSYSKSIIIRFIQNKVRYFLMRRYQQISETDIKSIESWRRIQFDEWNTNTVDEMNIKYGRNKLLFIDCISRKLLGHIPTHCMSLIFLTIIGTQNTNDYICWIIIRLTIECILYWYILMRWIFVPYSCNDNNILNSNTLRMILFGGSARIRDGYLAYYNTFMASISSGFAAIINYFIIVLIYSDPLINTKTFGVLIKLSSMGIVFGDAMGEIIGSLFGTYTFKVKGMGEINKKSIEGCIAVFIFTLLPSLFFIFNNYSNNLLLYGAVIIGSFIAMCAETFSFRSTDNLFIPLYCTIFYATFFRVFGI